MLRKQLSLILTFQETTHALAAERVCIAHSLPGRLIPVPREITAGCGLAWKASPHDQDAVCTVLTQEGIAWSQAYILEV